MSWSLLISWILINSVILKINAQCSVDIQQLTKDNQPAYILPDLSGFYPVTSDDKGTTIISVEADKSILVWCSNKIENTNEELTEFKCVKDNFFKIEGKQKNFNFYALKCKGESSWTVKPTQVSCYNNGKLFKVGVEIDPKNFLPLYTVCHDLSISANLFTKYTISRYAKNFQLKVEAPKFFIQPDESTGLYLKISVENLYNSKKQIQTIGKIINGNANKYITVGSAYILSRGHFAPKAGFVLASHQKATFNFINIAPQWKIINQNNWGQVEKWSRELAFQKETDLEAYTGALGVTGLENNDGILMPIYLYYGPARKKRDTTYNTRLSSGYGFNTASNSGVNNGLTTGQMYSTRLNNRHNSSLTSEQGFNSGLRIGQSNKLTPGYGFNTGLNNRVNNGLTSGQRLNTTLNTGYNSELLTGQGYNSRLTTTGSNYGSSRGFGSGLVTGQSSNINSRPNNGFNSGLNTGYGTLGRTSSNLGSNRGISTGQNRTFNSGLNNGFNRASSNLYTGRNTQQSTNRRSSQARCEINNFKNTRRSKREPNVYKIPVPQYYYTVLLAHGQQQGVVLIGKLTASSSKI